MPVHTRKGLASRLAGLLAVASVAFAVSAQAQTPAVNAAAHPPAVNAQVTHAVTPSPAPQLRDNAKEALLAAARSSRTPSYQGTNGKIYVNPTKRRQFRAIEKLTAKGSDVLQLLQTQGTQHTKAIFDGRMIHFQVRTGTSNWRLRSWGDRLRASDRTTYSGLIQLTPTEAANLRERIQAVEAEEGPENRAGEKWENGHIKTSMGSSFNCTSGWCGMRIGEHGETLAQLLEMPVHYDPYSLQPALEAAGSKRVFGVAVYGPKVPEFGAHPEQPQVKPR